MHGAERGVGMHRVLGWRQGHGTAGGHRGGRRQSLTWNSTTWLLNRCGLHSFGDGTNQVTCMFQAVCCKHTQTIIWVKLVIKMKCTFWTKCSSGYNFLIQLQKKWADLQFNAEQCLPYITTLVKSMKTGRIAWTILYWHTVRTTQVGQLIATFWGQVLQVLCH